MVDAHEELKRAKAQRDDARAENDRLQASLSSMRERTAELEEFGTACSYAKRRAIERAEAAEALAAERGEALELLDLSDEHTLQGAAPGEMISCTRPKEVWLEIAAALCATKGDPGE